MEKKKNALSSDILAKLADGDGFTVDFAGRDEYGNFRLDSNMFRVKVGPAGFFGQNIRDFDFETAVRLAEESDYDPDHDFGLCFVRERSLRKESDGRWYIDLLVDAAKARYIDVTTMTLHPETDEPMFGEDGRLIIRTAPRKESWITCELSMLEPVTDHAFAAVYLQRDPRLQALLRTNAQSAKIASSEGGGRSKSAGKRVRLTPAQIQAKLAELEAKQG